MCAMFVLRGVNTGPYNNIPKKKKKNIGPSEIKEQESPYKILGAVANDIRNGSLDLQLVMMDIWIAFDGSLPKSKLSTEFYFISYNYL